MAAGGKAGETSSVASLYATFNSDPKSVVGKSVELTGIYVNSSAQIHFWTTAGSSSVTTHDVVVSQTKDKDKILDLTIRCIVPADVSGLTQGDTVTVKGTVTASFHDPVVSDCTIAKAK